jgi:hypothetical protein
MKDAKQARPSKKAGFRLAAFTFAVAIFILSYWLGNRYKSPDLPDLQALLISPAQPLPEFSLMREGKAEPFTQQVDDWLLLWGGPLTDGDLRLLTSARNRLAADAKQQERFRVWLLQPSPLNLPDFIAVQSLLDGERARLHQSWQLAPGENLLFLINPQGRLQAVFTGIHSAATMATDFKAILDHFAP